MLRSFLSCQALFKTAGLLLTSVFESIGDEVDEVETRIIPLETKGVTHLRFFIHFHSFIGKVVFTWKSLFLNSKSPHKLIFSL